MNLKKKRFRITKNEGITLVALVVTVVILIILATVSISVTFGENGLIAKAKKAGKDTESAMTNEQELVDKLGDETANILASNGSGGDSTANWDLSKVTKVTSEDNIVVPVPIGYTASTVTGEKRVDTGFVIKEGSNGAATEGINEFVWVPVGNIEDLYDAKNNAGQLWDFGSSMSGFKKQAEKMEFPTIQSSGYHEPDVVTSAYGDLDSTSGPEYDAVLENLTEAGINSDLNDDGKIDAKDFKIQLEKEFKEMKDSVQKYGGFYIGRYETGNLSTETAVVQKKNKDISEQTWYTQYKLNKTIAANGNVTSSMIWGCQWDATLRWFQTSSNTEVSNFPTNSNGNYSGGKYQTGSYPEWAANNIYDMGGNVGDWTIESGFGDGRISRGAYYGSSGSLYPACTRSQGAVLLKLTVQLVLAQLCM